MGKVRRVVAPSRVESEYGLLVFMAGVISPWRDEVVREFQDVQITLVDPVRADWDSSWRQSVEDARFVEQAVWEFDMQGMADLVLFYFGSAEDDGVVTMMEFGICAERGVAIVLASPGFRRWGYIQVVCRELKVPIVSSVKDFREYVRSGIRSGLF